MSLGRIRLGEEFRGNRELLRRYRGYDKYYDYNHLLPLSERSDLNLILMISGHGTGMVLNVRLLSDSGDRIGEVESHISFDTDLRFDYSSLGDRYQKRGLGKAMYLSVLAHAFSLGVRVAVGGHHSSKAWRVHKSIVNEYKLTGYTPDGTPPEKFYGFDDRFGPYRYALR